MNRFILDTDTITLLKQGHSRVSDRTLAQPVGSVITSVITVDEQLSGWYTAMRKAKSPQLLSDGYAELAETVGYLGHFIILGFSVAAIEEFERLRRLKLGISGNDLRIAAIAIINDDIVVTRNVSDFGRIPNVRVENWAD